jgi:hypothetical protein
LKRGTNRHNEYNNNDEDYLKGSKDELISSIFKKRKDKIDSFSSPQKNLLHNVSVKEAKKNSIVSELNIERTVTPPPMGTRPSHKPSNTIDGKLFYLTFK